MKEVPHTKSIRKGSRPFEGIQADIAGPFPAAGNNGDLYWAGFLDDYTDITWVFPIRHKWKFENCFRKLLQQVETPTRRV
jgi:hypothetical protein